MLAGSVLIVVGLIGVWRSGPRHPAGLRPRPPPCRGRANRFREGRQNEFQPPSTGLAGEGGFEPPMS